MDHTIIRWKKKIYIYIYTHTHTLTPTLLYEQDVTHSQFSKLIYQVWVQFSFSQMSCHTKVKEPTLPDHFPIADGWIVGCIPFLWILALCEMKTALFRIWNHVIMSISYYNNHFTTNTSIPLYIYIYAGLIK